MTAVERAYGERYREWIARARPLLEAELWKEAFAGYPSVVNDAAPFTPLRRPLADCTIAPVTSGGLYLPAGQDPFDEPNPEGDLSHRALPTTLAQSDIGVAHGRYDAANALADDNSVYPVDRLRDLADDGVIAGLAPTGYSFMGYLTDAGTFAATTARAIAGEIAASGADGALLIPV